MRRLGDRAEFGHGHESPPVPKIHAVLLMPNRYELPEIFCIGRFDAPSSNLDSTNRQKREHDAELSDAVGNNRNWLAASGRGRRPTWRTEKVSVIVPYGAGSATDIVPRVVFEQLATQLGQPIVVEKRPAPGGTVGASFVATAKPDATRC